MTEHDGAPAVGHEVHIPAVEDRADRPSEAALDPVVGGPARTVPEGAGGVVPQDGAMRKRSEVHVAAVEDRAVKVPGVVTVGARGVVAFPARPVLELAPRIVAKHGATGHQRLIGAHPGDSWRPDRDHRASGSGLGTLAGFEVDVAAVEGGALRGMGGPDVVRGPARWIAERAGCIVPEDSRMEPLRVPPRRGDHVPPVEYRPVVALGGETVSRPGVVRLPADRMGELLVRVVAENSPCRVFVSCWGEKYTCRPSNTAPKNPVVSSPPVRPASYAANAPNGSVTPTATPAS